MMTVSNSVSAQFPSHNFGDAEADLGSDDVDVEVDDIQDWDFNWTNWNGVPIYFEVTTKWIDHTAAPEDFRVEFDFDVLVYPQGYPGQSQFGDHDELHIDDNSRNFANDQWFTDTLTCGPFVCDHPIVVYECWYLCQMWNDEEELYDNDTAHWFVYCVA
jgi:hypothetical protein